MRGQIGIGYERLAVLTFYASKGSARQVLGKTR
jgi:hypothetical protein